MRNFKIEHEGKEYWISRSISVVGVVVAIEQDGAYVLVNKRGEACPDFVGYWNCPCGYLDYDETLNQACSREIKEETGVDISPDQLILLSINSSPLENRQNVSVRFCTFLSQRAEIGNKAEDGESSEVEWLPINKVSEYEWAFNHQYLIAEVLRYGQQILSQSGEREATTGDVPETPQPDSSN